MRQIILDTETTGLSPQEGHRIIEIGCVEMVNRRLTGVHFHEYINPGRKVDAGAVEVHGITNEFLADKPSFIDIAKPFLEFAQGAELIIHNAPFDTGFIDHELGLAKIKPEKIINYCTIFDTLVAARKKHPGQRNSLDALCKRYNIDNSQRDLHGALLDAEILAKVYLAMTGGQVRLFTDSDFNQKNNRNNINTATQRVSKESRKPLPVILANEEELKSHDEYIQAIEKESGKNLWH